MPQNITDVATFTLPIVAPASGDPETAASVLTMGQGLANRTRLASNQIAAINASIGAASGIAPLDATARVAAANVRNGLISIQNVADVNLGSTYLPYPVMGNLTGITLSIAGTLVGDIVLFSYSLTFHGAGTSNDCEAQLTANQGGAGASFVAGSDTGGYVTTTQECAVAATGMFVITTAGTCVLQMQGVQGNSATTTYAGAKNSLTALLIRP
jgi:hypothetical protein